MRVSVLVLDRNQNSGFGRSLVDPVISTGRRIMNLVLNVCFDFFSTDIKIGSKRRTTHSNICTTKSTDDLLHYLYSGKE